MQTTTRALLADLALEPRFGFLRDRLWWALALAGLAVAAGLGFLMPLLHSRPRLTDPGQWLAAIVLQPLIEELAFRGLLQGVFLTLRGGRATCCRISMANLASSLLFAALHLRHQPPLWAAGVFLPSLALGWLRERSGSTWSPLLMHGLFNLEFFACAGLGWA